MSSSEQDIESVQHQMESLEIQQSNPTPATESKLSEAEMQELRRRLSMAGALSSTTGEKQNVVLLDGADTTRELIDAKAIIDAAHLLDDDVPPPPPEESHQTDEIIHSFHSVSRVGFVPFNNTKVNQDRACESHPFGAEQYSRAFFGVFDGHGQFGHHVSQFCATNLPKILSKQPDLLEDPIEALGRTFHGCHQVLISGKIDSSFSGTTAVCTYVQGNKIYCANAGDSRCVLGSVEDGAWVARDLSIDHKPSRPDERQRIIESGGRVDTCRAANREPIGPLRVWLRNQEVPGLAMTRSFGDRVAATVGVTHTPEIVTHTYRPGVDKIMVLASDGVWEFLSSRDVIEIASKCRTPEEAAVQLYKNSDARWRRDEEVIDDITVLVVFFK